MHASRNYFWGVIPNNPELLATEGGENRAKLSRSNKFQLARDGRKFLTADRHKIGVRKSNGDVTSGSKRPLATENESAS
jgi:hypothetical protein